MVPLNLGAAAPLTLKLHFEHVAAKEAVEEQHTERAGCEHNRDERAPRAAAEDLERIPNDPAKKFFREMDQRAKSQVAQRRERAGNRGEQNHLDVVVLIATESQLRFRRVNLGSGHPITLRESNFEEALDDRQRIIELIVMDPVAGLLDGNDLGVAEHPGAAVLLPIAGP